MRGATFDDWVRLLLDRARILHLGSGERGGYAFATRGSVLRIDIQRRFRPDVVGDTQRLPFCDGTFDAVVAMSILEHVPRPWDAIEEIRRVLAPRGLLVGYVPYMFPYHADETFHDYFRFSGDALNSLLETFESFEILKASGYTNAALRFLAGFTASERHLLRGERPLAAFVRGLARSTGLWGTTAVRGLLRSPTGYHFMAIK